MQLQRNTVLSGLILAAAVSRLVPHAPNFTALGAIALFGGATFACRWRAIAVPLVAMLVSDLLLGCLVYGVGNAFRYALPVYLCLVLTVFVGRVMGRSVAGKACGMLAATAIFFGLSNFAVWAGSGYYPPDLGGLLACYLAAVPFALNTLLANLLFGATLFGLLAWAERRGLEPARTLGGGEIRCHSCDPEMKPM